MRALEHFGLLNVHPFNYVIPNLYFYLSIVNMHILQTWNDQTKDNNLTMECAPNGTNDSFFGKKLGCNGVFKIKNPEKYVSDRKCLTSISIKVVAHISPGGLMAANSNKHSTVTKTRSQ